MLELIMSALHTNHVTVYQVQEVTKESCELFFIRRNLTMRRMKKVKSFEVTVFKDFEKENEKMRGSSTVFIYPGMTEKEIIEKVKSAVFAASYVLNPYYELYQGTKEPMVFDHSSLAAQSLEDTAKLFTNAIFAGDCNEQAFLNSCELFVTKETRHILSSSGCDVSYEKYGVNGELVAQCKLPRDVEVHDHFAYDTLAIEAITKKTSKLLTMCELRAKATKPPITGCYDVILSGDNVAALFEFYAAHANASAIYSQYSDYTVGKQVQGENVTGERLNITLKADRPYSKEGIKMKDLPLIYEGVLKNIYGNCQYCYYLSTQPTGDYNSAIVANGSSELSELKKQPYLEVLSFSDFKCDPMSGTCGGEIRLAEYYDGKEIQVLTGGSIQFSLFKVQDHFKFSKERYQTAEYDGPLSVRIEKVMTAGREKDETE